MSKGIQNISPINQFYWNIPSERPYYDPSSGSDCLETTHILSSTVGPYPSHLPILLLPPPHSLLLLWAEIQRINNFNFLLISSGFPRTNHIFSTWIISSSFEAIIQNTKNLVLASIESDKQVVLSSPQQPQQQE